MASVDSLIKSHQFRAQTIPESASILEAVQQMHMHRISCLVAIDRGVVTGILSEADVLREVSSRFGLLSAIRVRQAMTRDVVCCLANSSLDDALRLMTQHQIHHLPVVDADTGDLVGLINHDELVEALADMADQQIPQHDYSHS